MHIKASSLASLPHCLVGLVALGALAPHLQAQTTTPKKPPAAPAKPATPAKPQAADRGASAAGAAATHTAATKTNSQSEPAKASSIDPANAHNTPAIGQTKDHVIARLGNPIRVTNLANKEIDFYPKMQVVYVKNRVSAIQ